MPGTSQSRGAPPARHTDAEVLAARQQAAHAQRGGAGQHVGCRAPLLWGYRGLAAIAGESASSARLRAQRMVAAGVLERLPGRPVIVQARARARGPLSRAPPRSSTGDDPIVRGNQSLFVAVPATKSRVVTNAARPTRRRPV